MYARNNDLVMALVSRATFREVASGEREATRSLARRNKT